jgi:hypothetical protein
MAGKYYQRIDGIDYDVATLCEPKVHDAASGFGTEFTGEGEFQKAGTDTENITLEGYTVNGTSITTVKNGYCPSFSKLVWSCNTAGSYSLVRSDTELKITTGIEGTGDVLASFNPSDFRGGVIPNEFIFFLVGGGGGGGGCGYFSPGKDRDGFVKVPGGAGGGGGYAVGRIRLTGSTKVSMFVGKGGAAGTDGTSGQKSDGSGLNNSGSFNSGGNSIIFDPSGYYGIWASNGNGGTGGGYDPDNEDGAVPGDGGYAGRGAFGDGKGTASGYKCFINVQFGSGGRGNYYGSHDNTKAEGLTYTPTSGTGASAKTLVSEKNLNGSN